MSRIHARNINEVIDFMNAFISQAIMQGDRTGYFAGLYRMVTVVVRDYCDKEHFEDHERMRELDTCFANRYFEALYAYRQKKPLTDCWRLAFTAATDSDLMIMQHLLLGMNAHINLDLGIATAEVSGGVLTQSLRRDFDRLNDILTELSGRVQNEIIQVSPIFRRLKPVYKYFDEMFVRVGITTARTQAWNFAEQLIGLPAEDWAYAIRDRDITAAISARLIQNPGPQLMPLIRQVSKQEKTDIHTVVSVLSEESTNRPLYFNIDRVREMARKRGIDMDTEE